MKYFGFLVDRDDDEHDTTEDDDDDNTEDDDDDDNKDDTDNPHQQQRPPRRHRQPVADVVPLGFVDWGRRSCRNNILQDLLDLFVFGTTMTTDEMMTTTNPATTTTTSTQNATLRPPALHNGKVNAYYETITGHPWTKNGAASPPDNNDNPNTTTTKLPLLCFENVLSGQYWMSDHGEDVTQHGLVHENDDDGPNLHWAARADVLYQFRNDFLRRLGRSPQYDGQLRRGCAGTRNNESDNNNNNETTKQQQHPSVLILPRLPGSVQ